MKARSALALVLFIVIPFVVGGLGSLATAGNVDGWYAAANKAFWTPPNWVFAPVWSVLYALMGISAWLVWRTPSSASRRSGLWLFVVQLALNAVWTPVFFAGFPIWGVPALWLGAIIITAMDVLVLLTMTYFSRVRLAAAILLIPYWAWLLYATTLNYFLALYN